jgi:DNA-3-methyladenine glycosylase II
MFFSELTLQPVSPFSFDLSARIFENGDPQIRVYRDGKFKQVIRLGDKLVLVLLESVGFLDKPKLKVHLKANFEVSHDDVEQARRIVTRLFNLDLDLAEFYELARKEATLNGIVQQLWGLRSPTTQTVYEALIDSIVEQQISLKVATSMERRVIKTFGEALTLGGETYFAYPTAAVLAQVSIEELRACGLSGSKAQYVKQISGEIVKGNLDLEKFRGYSNTEDVVRELDEVKGVGPWTAELTVIRALQKWDAMPADDVGLRRILSRFYSGGIRISSDEAKHIAEPWGCWRGLAAFYFVVAELVGVKA